MKFTIYKITNKDNGKSYIGCTSRPTKWRWIEHIKALEHNRHKVEDFQKDFNEGSKKFDFEILQENVEEVGSRYIEKNWMIKFKTNDRRYGYNYKDTIFGKKGEKRCHTN